MTILHYTIGLPPKRRGGSVQYACDIIHEQARIGHKVLALTCGDTLFRAKETTITYSNNDGTIPVFHLTNPLTPTLIYGVSDPNSQHRNLKINRDSIIRFIKTNNIDILHLHTLMGIHSDVVKIFKGHGVRIVYTTHDFHGICPHYNLINEKGELCDGNACGKRCIQCNRNEPTETFLRIANSQLYQRVKQSGLFSYIQKPKKESTRRKTNIPTEITEKAIKSFDNLLEYYRNYFGLIDYFHFNSSQTREKFEHVLGPLNGEVIPVVTAGVSDLRKRLNISDSVTFGFIGNLNDYKGFPILKDILKELESEGYYNFHLKVYGSNLRGIDPDCTRIEYFSPYSINEISDILYDLDAVIVPSKWYETFSLVTIECLAHGRPAIVSDHVGAKDIVRKVSSELVFADKYELKELIRRCLTDPEYLIRINNRILHIDWEYTLPNHTMDITSIYQYLLH